MLAIVESRGPISERGIFGQLKAAGIAVSRNTISEALDALKASERVTLTDRGWVVARVALLAPCEKPQGRARGPPQHRR